MINKQIKVAEQEEILDINKKNIIVSASAGSGKTTVMVKKILKYVLERDCHIDELLVLTYTKSSALDMKKKLTNKIKEELQNNSWLQEELDLIPTSDICTFDSFCQKLVKKYFYILDIDPSFSILEGSDQTFYQDKAISNAINVMKKEQPLAYENLITNFSPSRDEKTIKSLVLEIYNYLTSVFEQDDFIETTYRLYNAHLKIAEKVIKEYYFNIFMKIKIELEYLKEQCANYGFSKYQKYVNEVLIIVEAVLCEKDFCKMVDYLQGVSFPVLRAEKEDNVGFKEKIAEKKSILSKLIEEIKKQYIDSQNIKKSYKNCEFLIKNLIKLLFLFKNEYSNIKSSLNAYDFDDVERLTIHLLTSGQTIDEIKNNYKHIFVDEFQDANKVQEKIIFLLNNNNLFFVGDTKQSIYAFRQSDPDIFLNIQNNFRTDEKSCEKKLNCNFRTNKHILDFVNNIFNVIMTETTCGLNYQKEAQFISKAEYQDLPNEICVSLNVLIPSQKPEDKRKVEKVYSVFENSKIVNVQNKFDEESAFICQQIISMVGTNIYDKELGKIRKLGFNDVTILLLKRGKFLDNLIKHFLEVGIPFVVNINKNLEECYDNHVLYCMIKLAMNLRDDYSLYAVLSSPLFNFSDSELAYIKQQKQECLHFYECVINYDENDELHQKIDNFLKKVEYFSYLLSYFGIFYALNKLIKDTNYLLNISYDDDYLERKANIVAFIDSFAESKYNLNVCEYLKYREYAIRQEKVQTEKTFVEAVNITTMHSSKGLEYPVVILPFLNQDFTKEPNHSDIKINKILGVGVKNYDQNDRTISGGIFYNACKIKNRQIEMSEKIRLLYVATTRAKNKLILTGTLNKDVSQLKSDFEIIRSNNYLDLILGSLNEGIIDNVNKKQQFNDYLFDNSRIQLSVICPTLQDINKTPIIMPKQSDEVAINELSEFLNKDLRSQISNIALKNSVSNLLADENASQNFAPSKLLITEHLQEKVNDVGTLYHKVLQKIEFKDIKSVFDVQDFIACNFPDEEIKVLNTIGYDNIYENIEIIKQFICPCDIVLKEQKFVMCTNYCQVSKSDIQDKVLIQGVIDLMIVKKEQIILIDYKMSDKTASQLKQTYSKQIEFYSMAISKQFKNFKIKKMILSLKKNQIIEM